METRLSFAADGLCAFLTRGTATQPGKILFQIVYLLQNVSDAVLYFSEVKIIHKESFNDWIWDVCLLHETPAEDSHRIAVVTGHNAVWIYDFNEAKKWLISQCEEQCILYPFTLIQ